MLCQHWAEKLTKQGEAYPELLQKLDCGSAFVHQGLQERMERLHGMIALTSTIVGAAKCRLFSVQSAEKKPSSPARDVLLVTF